ncbi:MAG: hypothetical protein Tsb0032_30780 [Kiloniellaceae bacterium]
MTSFMKFPLSTVLAMAFGAAVVLAAPAQGAPESRNTLEAADTDGRDGSQKRARRAPRIIYGESQGATFDFSESRVPRRVNPGDRRAYFGSGESYQEALARLQASLDRMIARERQARLGEAASGEAAGGDMPPALQRALTLARQARQAEAGGE